MRGSYRSHSKNSHIFIFFDKRQAGFDALYAYIMENDYSLTWMRHVAALLVVFVSDEQEQSNVYFSQVNQFLSWVTSYRNNVYLASIVNLPQADTLCPHQATWDGTRYIDATNYLGGQIIDICSEDWTAGVQDASTQIEPYEYWELTHVPLDENFIFVFVDGHFTHHQSGRLDRNITIEQREYSRMALHLVAQQSGECLPYRSVHFADDQFRFCGCRLGATTDQRFAYTDANTLTHLCCPFLEGPITRVSCRVPLSSPS